MLYYDNKELYHHGIFGQKWGIRRYQNYDGSFTPEGKKRYLVGDAISDGDIADEAKKNPETTSLDKLRKKQRNINLIREEVMMRPVSALKPYDYAIVYDRVGDKFFQMPIVDILAM